jgi:uncharacterized membrane protein YvlD (DUF360 family)
MPYMLASALSAALAFALAWSQGAWHVAGGWPFWVWVGAGCLANALVRPAAILAQMPLTVATLGLLLLATNAVWLGLVPLLVPGFKLVLPVWALGAAGVVAIANAAWAGKLG